MHLKKRFLSVAAVILCTAAAVYSSTLPMGKAGGTGNSLGPGSNKETIYFWYTDDSMTSFINSATVDFGQEKGVRVIPVLTSEGEYLEAIGQASLHGPQMPDLYLLTNDSLEKAYLAGLATETGDEGSVCNTDNFPKSALSAVNYHGKNIAYPLYFETSALIYNASYMQQWQEQQEAKLAAAESGEEVVDGGEVVEDEETKDVLASASLATVDDILTVADTFDVPEGVEGIMKWDVSDIFYNYWFVGSYLNVGGEAGDDEQNIDINNPETVQCLEVYQALNQFFSMEADTITYDSVVQDFVDGKIMFTVATSDIINRLETAKADGSFAFDYGITTMPRVSAELDSAALSVTGAIAVNGYSEHKELANEFAAYLVTARADELYEKSGKLAANLATESDNGGAQMFKQAYAESVSLPKMMETGNYWIQLEVLFSKVWNGSDVATLLEELANQISTQISEE